MQKFSIIFICVIFSLTFVSCNSTDSEAVPQEAEYKTEVKEATEYTIYPEEITVEVGETFKINYTPSDQERCILGFRDNGGPQEMRSKLIESVGRTWDPLKGIQWTDPIGCETFKALSPGTTVVGDIYSSKSTCTVTIIESTQKEDPNPQVEEKPKQSVSIVLKNNLPQEFHYRVSGRLCSICKIKEAKINYSSDRITLNVLGEKTYDWQGGSSTLCVVYWKLYNSSNIVVKSGQILANNINLNEQFLKDDIIAFASQLAPGTYTLMLTDVN